MNRILTSFKYMFRVETDGTYDFLVQTFSKSDFKKAKNIAEKTMKDYSEMNNLFRYAIKRNTAETIEEALHEAGVNALLYTVMDID